MTVPSLVAALVLVALAFTVLVAIVAIAALIRANRELDALRTTVDALHVDLGLTKVWPTGHTDRRDRIRRLA